MCKIAGSRIRCMPDAIHHRVQTALYRIGSFIGCHQRQERSYFIRGRQVPVCARCLGMLIGLAVAPAFRFNVALGAALLLPMLIDGGTQAFRLRESRNWLRLVTGIGFTLGAETLLIHACEQLWTT